jgi:hypothetical protein
MRKLGLIVILFLSWSFGFAQQTAQVSGYVFSNEEGNPPLVGVLVVLTTALGNEYEASTDADGLYEFSEITANPDWPTGISCIYSKSGFINDTINTFISAGQNNELEDVILQEMGDVIGQVQLNNSIFPDIGDVENVNIILYSSNDDSLSTVQPDVDGNYLFDAVSSGEYKLKAELDKFVPVEYLFEKDSTENDTINFILNFKPGNVSGSVALNVPEGSIQEVVISIGDSISLNPDESGYYATTGIAAGIYVITYGLQDFESVIISDFSLLPDQGNEVPSQTLQWNFARLSGVVSDTDDNLLEAVELQIGDSIVYTNYDGIYQFSKLPLPDGEIAINWSKESYLDSTKMISLSSGYETLDLVMKFRPVIEVIDNMEFTSKIIGQSEVKEIPVKFYYSDSLVITAPDEDVFALQDEEGNWINELVFPGGYDTIIDTVYVRFKPEEDIEYSENLILKAFPGPTEFSINLTGKGLSPMSASIQTSSNLVCPGSEVELKAIDTYGGNGHYTFEWQSGGVTLGDTISVLVYPSEETLYTLKVTDDLENSFESTILIEVYTAPQLTTQPDAKEICALETAEFSVGLDDEESVTYQWKKKMGDEWRDIDGATANSLSIETSQDDFGFILKCEIKRCDFVEESEPVKLTINPLPLDTIYIKQSEGGPAVLISPDSGMVYQWYRDDAALENANGQFYYAEAYEQGSYRVELKNPVTGCKVKSANSYDVSAEKNAVIYPNPAENQLNIILNSEIPEYGIQLRIAGLSGRVEKEVSYQTSGKSLKIGVEDLRPGIYFLYIQSVGGQLIEVKRFVKVK